MRASACVSTVRQRGSSWPWPKTTPSQEAEAHDGATRKRLAHRIKQLKLSEVGGSGRLVHWEAGAASDSSSSQQAFEGCVRLGYAKGPSPTNTIQAGGPDMKYLREALGCCSKCAGERVCWSAPETQQDKALTHPCLLAQSTTSPHPPTCVAWSQRQCVYHSHPGKSP